MKVRESGSDLRPGGEPRGGESLRVFGKYWLFQTPGIVLAAVVLYALHSFEVLSARWALLLFAFWLAKELLLFPILRIAYEPHRKGGVHDLVGARGTASDDLAPSGYIRLGAELWRAEIRGTGAPIAAGSRVRVRAVLGLTLVCEPDDEEHATGEPPAARAGRAVTTEGT